MIGLLWSPHPKSRFAQLCVTIVPWALLSTRKNWPHSGTVREKGTLSKAVPNNDKGPMRKGLQRRALAKSCRDSCLGLL